MRKSRMILLVSLIISLAVIGVGYAAWTDQITMKIGISTGHTDVEVDIEEGKTWLGNGQYLDVEVNGNDIEITGEVYSGLDYVLKLDIFDVGTVPLVFKETKGDNNDVISLERRISSLSSDTLNTNELRESFDLFIKTVDYKDTGFKTLSVANAEHEDQIESIKRKIEIVEKGIEDYKEDIIEEYKLKYEILFEQVGSGSWNEEITISGKIKVVTDPEVLDEMETKLEDMKDDLKILKGEELEEAEIEEVEIIDEEEILEEEIQEEEIDSNEVVEPNVDQDIEEEIKEEKAPDEREGQEEKADD